MGAIEIVGSKVGENVLGSKVGENVLGSKVGGCAAINMLQTI